MFLGRAGACLTAALILAPAVHASDYTSQQPPATSAQPEAGQKPPQADPQARKKRSPRKSKRQPSSNARGTFEENRTSRVAGPTRQELAFTANVMGGYDDNLTGGLGVGTGAAPTAMVSGTTANMDAALGYFRGNALRSVRLDTTGTLTAYPGYLDRPAPGGIANVDARTNAGRDTTLAISERLGYEPFFSALSQGAGGALLPPDAGGAATAASLFERRSWNSNTALSLDRRWAHGAATSLGYAYRRQEFTNEDPGDNASHNVTAGYRQRLGTSVRGRVDYRYQEIDYTDSASSNRSTRDHRIEAGPEMEAQFSRRRRLSLLLKAGAGYIETAASATRQAYDAWVPMGSARLTLTLSPTAFVEGEYRRDFSLFQGVTDEVYTTDSAYVRTGGRLTSRFALTLGGTYSNWATPVASGVTDTMKVYGATSQLQILLSQNLAATVGYYYYNHHYSNPGALPEGFPARYDRNAVRIGFTLWVPIIGAPTSPPVTPR